MALANPPVGPKDALMVAFKKDMVEIGPYLESMLPKAIVPRFIRMAQLAVLRDPKLMECTRKSLLLAILWCAQKNLEPGVDDGCWLIPFKGKVVPIPAYKGLIAKAAEYGAAKSVDAYAVYEHDNFFYEYGLDPKVEHTPPKLGEDRGELVGAYVVITLPNGDKKFRVMDWPSIEKVRNASAAWKGAPDSGPWHDWTEAMSLKTVIKNGLKTVPMAPDLRDLLGDDHRLEMGAGVGALLAEAGAEVPDDLRGAETEKPEEETTARKSKVDITAFDLLVKKELAAAGLDETAADFRLEHLKENLKISAKNTKKSVDQFKEFAANYFYPYTSAKDGTEKPGFWHTFLTWEADRYPTTTPEAQAAADAAHAQQTGSGEGGEAQETGTGAGAPGAQGTGGEENEDPFAPKQEPQPIFADQKKALVMKILGKPIPLADLGITSLDADIMPENFAAISQKVEAILATGGKKKK